MFKVKTLRTRLVALSVLTLAPASGEWVFAQAPPPRRNVDPAANPRFRAAAEAINQRARELGLIEAEENDDTGFYRRRVVAQLTEDFGRLHSIDSERLPALTSAAAIDHKTLSEVTAEIKRRATRIKQNLAALLTGAAGGKTRYQESPDQLGSMLPELSRLIGSFLESPVFRISSPNDTELRAKASRDLEDIIRLSDTLNRVAKRMSKAATPGK